METFYLIGAQFELETCGHRRTDFQLQAGGPVADAVPCFRIKNFLGPRLGELEHVQAVGFS